MLRHLQVRNFAIIDEIELDFGSGMTVLTGETGAGKSILVDALGLVLGERGGSGLVRSGAKRAEFSAEFDLRAHPAARAWLTEQAVDLDDECLLRRVVGTDGRSRAFVNGNAVTLQSLKSLGQLLADIHGQHFHQSLGRVDIQRDILDHYGKLLDRRRDTGEAFRRWHELETQLDELRAAEAERESRLDLLEFQVTELDALDLQADEYDSLVSERQKLQNVGRLAEGLARVLYAASDGEDASARSLVASACQELQALTDFDEQLGPALALFEEAGIQLAEASDLLHRYVDGLEADPARRDRVEERLDALRTVARKHRVEPGDLGELQARLRDELQALRNIGERNAELERDVAAARRHYLELANGLSGARADTAVAFAAEVTRAMTGLGMPGGRFEVSIDRRDDAEARADGIDRIGFLISANPGQPLLPLAKVASGGELSRMSLAIQVIASDGSRIPTMVFDEVDSGVGGGVAEMVGRRLCELGAARQVLCVTHLPQVASQADHHLRITKVTDGRSTRTRICDLEPGERIEELARMLGGVDITARTREHAAEMLAAGGRSGRGRKRATR